MSPELQEAEAIVPTVQVEAITAATMAALLEVYVPDYVTRACGVLFDRTVQFDPQLAPTHDSGTTSYEGVEHEVVGARDNGQPIVNRYEAVFSVEEPDFWAKAAAWMRRRPRPGPRGRLVRGKLVNLNES